MKKNLICVLFICMSCVAFAANPIKKIKLKVPVKEKTSKTFLDPVDMYYILFDDGCFHLGVESGGWWEPTANDRGNYPGFAHVICPYTSEDMMYIC